MGLFDFKPKDEPSKQAAAEQQRNGSDSIEHDLEYDESLMEERADRTRKHDDADEDDTEVIKELSKKSQLFRLEECREIADLVAECYKKNKGTYGCEQYMEQFEQCRRKEISKQMKMNSDKEWIEFRQKRVEEKRQKIKDQALRQADEFERQRKNSV